MKSAVNISILRAEMTCVGATMHDQIEHDLDSTEAALRLMAMRGELATLVAQWKAAGGSEPRRQRASADHPGAFKGE
jgi:hypothetical protein